MSDSSGDTFAGVFFLIVAIALGIIALGIIGLYKVDKRSREIVDLKNQAIERGYAEIIYTNKASVEVVVGIFKWKDGE